MVSDHRRQKPVHLLVGDFHLLMCHRVPKDALPDIVVVLEQMPDQGGLITALVAVFVLDEGHKVSSL